MQNKFSRRNFLVRSGITTAGLSLGYHPTKWSPGDQIRIGIIGTGSRGQGLAHEISKIPHFSLDACCDIVPKHLDQGMKFASKGAGAYLDYRELLDNQEIDAVVISTPLYLHGAMVKDAVDAQKHIYCEKTMALNTQETLEITKIIKGSDRVFQVGFQYRYYPLYDAVFEGIQSGDIGDVKHFICHYNRNNNWRRTVDDPAREKQINWRMYRAFSGGVTAELSAHEIDVMNRMFGGPPDKITGFGSINTYEDGREIFDNINLIFNYPNNITGNVTCHLSNQHQPYVIKILGTKGSVEIHRDKAFYYAEPGLLGKKNPITGMVDGVSGATLKVVPGKPWQIPVELKEGWSATTYAFYGFADSIKNGTEVRSSVETGKQASIAVDMANLAMEHERIERWQEAYNI